VTISFSTQLDDCAGSEKLTQPVNETTRLRVDCSNRFSGYGRNAAVPVPGDAIADLNLAFHCDRRELQAHRSQNCSQKSVLQRKMARPIARAER
jgi:hypothetical protein